MPYRSTLVPATLPAAIRRVITAFLRHLRHARVGRAGGIHQARVATRRLREILPVLAHCAAIDVRTPRRQIRRLARAMGRARELDVLLGLAHTHPVAADWTPAVRHRVDRELREARATAQDRLVARLTATDVPALASTLRALVRQMTPAGVRCAEDAMAARRRVRALELRRALAAAGTLYAPSSLHAARIATKKLRYTLEWARIGGPPALPAQLAELKAAQQLLGQIQDLHTLQASLRQLMAHGKLDRAVLRALHDASARIDALNRQQHAQFVTRVPALSALTTDLARKTPLSWIRRRPLRIHAGDPRQEPARRTSNRT